ncbi:unnamed protein product [Knipowitschia caucasica]
MMNNYTFIKVVGRGSYGEVHLVTHRTDRKQYVVKKLDLRASSRRERRCAEQEAQLLSRLRHPNIVTYRESWEGDDCLLFIVMGFCEGGDLYHRLKHQQGALLPETQVVEWFVQIAMALQYLHDRHILHRDLKTQNIFLTKTNIIKVGDLGIAKVLENHSDMAMTLIGTPYYMSPELLCNRPYNHKSDVWALGCCVYEMCTLKHAFNAKDINSLVYRIVEGKLPQMPSQYDAQLGDLIRRMLSKRPEERPDVRGVLRQTYIRKQIALFLEATKEKTKRKSSVGGDCGSWKTGLKSPPLRPKQPERLPLPKSQNGSSDIPSKRSTPPPKPPPPKSLSPETLPPKTPPPETPPPETPPSETPPPETRDLSMATISSISVSIRHPSPGPTHKHTHHPSPGPTHKHTHHPSPGPTHKHTHHPSPGPTHKHTHHPSPGPTHKHTHHPSPGPTHKHTHHPSPGPTHKHTHHPSPGPTHKHTHHPSPGPTHKHTHHPSPGPTDTHTHTHHPSPGPTDTHTHTHHPSPGPTDTHTHTHHPSPGPTHKHTHHPSPGPTDTHTHHPSPGPTDTHTHTHHPSPGPTDTHTHHPSPGPTDTHTHTHHPSPGPTDTHTHHPSPGPTDTHTHHPSPGPTDTHTHHPSPGPTDTHTHTHHPSPGPTDTHTHTHHPSPGPTDTYTHTHHPSPGPTHKHTHHPSPGPTDTHTHHPSPGPTDTHTHHPSPGPTDTHTHHPSPGPTDTHTHHPSPGPTDTHTHHPSLGGAGLPLGVEEEEEKKEEKKEKEEQGEVRGHMLLQGSENNRTKLKIPALRPLPLPLVQAKPLHKKKQGTNADKRPMVPAVTAGRTLSARERRRLRQQESGTSFTAESGTSFTTESGTSFTTESGINPVRRLSCPGTSPRPQTEAVYPRPQTEAVCPRLQTEGVSDEEEWSSGSEVPAGEQRKPESSEMQDLVLMMTQTLKMAAGDGDASCDLQEFRLNRKYRDTLLLHGKTPERELSITSISHMSSVRLRRTMEQLRTDALQGLGVSLLQRVLEVMEEEDEDLRELRLREQMGDKYQPYAVMVRQLKFLEDTTLRI